MASRIAARPISDEAVKRAAPGSQDSEKQEQAAKRAAATIPGNAGSEKSDSYAAVVAVLNPTLRVILRFAIHVS